MEIKFSNVLGFGTEDPKFPAANLLLGNKWISEKKSQRNANSITLSLPKACIIHAIDIGNWGSSFISVEVSRVGVSSFEYLLPSTEFMSGRDALTKKNWTCVRMFTSADFVEDVRGKKWDLVRVTCTQPFLQGEQFGLSFFKTFSFIEKESTPAKTITPPPESAFTRMRNQISTKLSPVVNRREQLLLATKETLCHSMNGSPKDTSSSSSVVSVKELTPLWKNRKRMHSVSPFSDNEDEPQSTRNCVQKIGLTTRKRVNSTKTSPHNTRVREFDTDVVALSDDESEFSTFVPLQTTSIGSELPPGRLMWRSGGHSETTLNREELKKSKKNLSNTTPPAASSESDESRISDQQSEILAIPGPSKVPCPLCSERFDVSCIEQHAATCENEQGKTEICPICSVSVPLDILAYHADLCAEKMECQEV